MQSNEVSGLFVVPEVALEVGLLAGKDEKETIQQVSNATKGVFAHLSTYTDAQSYAAAMNAAANWRRLHPAA